MQGLSSELRLPVADLPAHRVSPAILTLADNGDVGVKTLNADNVVEFHPVTIVADGPDGLWLVGLPEKVTFITVGQEFVQPGQKVQPVPDDGSLRLMNTIIDFALHHTRTVLSALVLLVGYGLCLLYRPAQGIRSEHQPCRSSTCGSASRASRRRIPSGCCCGRWSRSCAPSRASSR